MAFTFVYYYDGKVPYMFFYTVLVLPVVSFLQMIAGYFILSYEQNLNSDSIIKGDEVTLKVNIINKSFLFLPYVKISFFNDRDGVIENNKVNNIVVEPLPIPTSTKIIKVHEINNLLVQPFSKKELSFNYTYKYRGYFKIGVSSIELHDFLGIFKVTRKNKNQLFIRVYPQIIDIDRFNLNTGSFSNSISTIGGVQEDVSTIEDINKYSYGDSLKKIHWKLSAKTNELMVKEYEKVGSTSVIFICNLEKSDSLAEKNVFIEDKHIEVVIAVLKHFTHHGVDLKFVYDDGEINTIQCSNSFDFQNIYEVLAKVEFKERKRDKTKEETSFGDIINSQINYNINKGYLIISTSKLDYKFYEALYKLNLEGYDISLIYIHDEDSINEDSEDVLGLLSKLRIKIYSINLTDDIKEIFK